MADETKPSTPGSMNPPPSSSSPSGQVSPKPPAPHHFETAQSGGGQGGPAFSIPSDAGYVPTTPKPSWPSPLTPDIKIPPNLPTGEMKPPVVSTPSPLKPPTTLGTPPVPPISPTPPTTFGSPKVVGDKPPVPSAPVSQTTPSAIFKSSIRTMQDDLAALKKGETPAGFKIEKESEKETKPLTTETQKGQEARKITPPPPISHVELGKLEKAKPLTAELSPLRQTGLGAGQTQKVQTPSQISIPKPSLGIPSVGGLTTKLDGLISRRIFLVIVSLVVAGGITIGFVTLRGPEIPQTSTTPTFTPHAPTATPVSIESLFSTTETIGISLGSDFTNRFSGSAKLDPLVSSRGAGIYKITSVDGTKRYGFTEFLGGITPKIEIPSELETLIDNPSPLLTLLYKSDNKLGFGFIVKLQSPNAVNQAVIALKNWERTMSGSLASLFQFDQSKTASIGFLDNMYNSVSIRYRNFPNTSTTIDYAVFKAKNGESYLIMVNSREHIYKIIDKLR